MNSFPYEKAGEIAARFKAAGVPRQESWSRWVQITSLRPGMDAADWYAIYDSVTAAALPPVAAQQQCCINTTHFDTLLQRNVEISRRDNGVFHLQWEDGHTGSEPPCCPPDPQRYKAII